MTTDSITNQPIKHAPDAPKRLVLVMIALCYLSEIIYFIGHPLLPGSLMDQFIVMFLSIPFLVWAFFSFVINELSDRLRGEIDNLKNDKNALLSANDSLHIEQGNLENKIARYEREKKVLWEMLDASQHRSFHEQMAEGSHTNDEWEMVKKYYRYTCLRCGKHEPEIKLTQDHIIPISRGGSDEIHNIQPLCFGCNSAKKDRTIDYRGKWTVGGASCLNK